MGSNPGTWVIKKEKLSLEKVLLVGLFADLFLLQS